jgi:hypothetical protein
MRQLRFGNLDRRVEVLFFTPTLGNGGAEMHLLRLINYLDRKQFSLSLALARPGGPYESALARDVKVYVLNADGVTSSTASMIRSIWPLRRLIQTERPDIVCSVMNHANIVAILACSRLSTRPKVVICVQNPPASSIVILGILFLDCSSYLCPVYTYMPIKSLRFRRV